MLIPALSSYSDQEGHVVQTVQSQDSAASVSLAR